MAWSTLDFGKHIGVTLPHALLKDPDWFFWAMETGVFDRKPKYSRQANDLKRRATSIRIPINESRELVVEHVAYPNTGTYVRFDIVPRTQPRHIGSSPTFRSDYIDLSIPRKLKDYDKLGGKELIKSLKFHILGNANIRITAKLAEDFFDDLENFNEF